MLLLCRLVTPSCCVWGPVRLWVRSGPAFRRSWVWRRLSLRGGSWRTCRRAHPHTTWQVRGGVERGGWGERGLRGEVGGVHWEGWVSFVQTRDASRLAPSSPHLWHPLQLPSACKRCLHETYPSLTSHPLLPPPPIFLPPHSPHRQRHCVPGVPCPAGSRHRG